MVTLNTEIKLICLAASLLAERQIFLRRLNFHWGHISTVGGHMSALSAQTLKSFLYIYRYAAEADIHIRA